jgi:Zn finger protein HypA/HybF involved in hydrogenase expression
MRELDVTKALFDKMIKSPDASRMKQIQIAIGEISELDQNVIERHWVELTRGTAMERATLRFRPVIAEVQCMSCFKKYHPVNGIIHCQNCGSFGAKILSGEGFHVETIETYSE